MNYQIRSDIQAVFDALLADAKVRRALAFIDADHDKKVAEIREMALLHGAPFMEKELRSPMFKKKLEEYGASGCFIDAHDNAFGFVPGEAASGPQVVLEGHLDTVFAKATPLAVTEKDGRLYCPGIGDDTAGLATVLAVLRAMRHAGLAPVHSLLIGGTSGEEGEGDIRGIKGLLDDHPAVKAVVSIEPGSAGNIVYGAVGSRRYELVFKGPGGHSWSAYGLPSPIHAMGRAIAKMADVATQDTPKTTYTVGVVSGGTSVNSIALEARCKLDMRSVSSASLTELETRMLALAKDAVDEENRFREASGARITLDVLPLGDRPAGEQAQDSTIVQATWAATLAVGAEPVLMPHSSTNANAPISRGIPAVVLRTGGDTGGTHTLDEWFDPANSQTGVKNALLLALALAGLQGVTNPLL